MSTINELKEQQILETPLLLFECTLAPGEVERWSTHKVVAGGDEYKARVLQHNVFDLSLHHDEGIDSVATVSVTLANADGHFSQIARNQGWKGARLAVRFVFYNLKDGEASSELTTIFRGVANPPDVITETTLRLTFNNRLNLHRVLLPQVRIQKRCPWVFPSSAAQREEALHGGTKGKYSLLFRCGYSAGVEGGCGNLQGGQPYAECSYTRQACEERGMFSKDSQNQPTRTFGGMEFVPSSILVRTHGDKSWHASPLIENEARYNDFVPLVYGTNWYQPPVTFARNDGNLTRMEVLLGMGEIQSVVKVLVNGIEIPAGRTDVNMTGTGWFNVVSYGNRTGDFNMEFGDSTGNPAGDPYGSMAILSVVAPNRINDGSKLPKIEVLVEGLKLPRFDQEGNEPGEVFTNNPAWVLLDVLRRCGWEKDEIDLASFATAAAQCDETVETTDLNGNPTSIPRYGCNLVLRKRRSAADTVRGIRNSAGLYLTAGADGKLALRTEGSLEYQQPVKDEGSNATETLGGGWPIYEFGDGSTGHSGILRNEHGEPQFRLWAKPMSDTPNRFSVELQDAFNEYQQDSLSMVDFEDVLTSGQETAVTFSALGIPNPDQAMRMLKRELYRSVRGNVFAEFETSVKAIHLRPGDLITITYLREGLERQPFRVIQIKPQHNYRTVKITAQLHDDAWYAGDEYDATGYAGRQPRSGVGLPRPLAGVSTDEFGEQQFEVTEQAVVTSDGSTALSLTVAFGAPRSPSPSSRGVPIVSLSPQVTTNAGTLRGSQTLYYTLTALDDAGNESGLSFLVRAQIPSGGNTNSVMLTGISLPPGAVAMNAYRGRTPALMYEIAASAAVSASFTDGGLTSTLGCPPDENFDRANFYWRLEVIGEQSVDFAAESGIGNSELEMTPGEHTGKSVRIVRGPGTGQERIIATNTATIIMTTSAWEVEPDASSVFVVAETGWNYGATARSSPVSFTVPNRQGATVHIMGSSANTEGKECPPELNVVTRWRLQGGGEPGDEDVAEAPLFGMATDGQGYLEVGGISFHSLTNTRTVTAATLTLYFWDELKSPCDSSMVQGISDSDLYLDLNAAGTAQIDDMLEIEDEILSVEEVLNGGERYKVRRASHGSTAAAHGAGSAVYHLDRKVSIIPFGKGFFGSPFSGSFAQTVTIPNVRISAAEMFVTNLHGNSPTTYRNYTSTEESGLRTLSGGQITMQLEGPLAIEDDAAAPLIVEGAHAIQEILAMVREAPTGSPVVVRLWLDDVEVCQLTIPAGAHVSNTVEGFGLAPLTDGSMLKLDVVSVGLDVQDSPGQDLTLTIRL